jgi:hypothetical protein
MAITIPTLGGVTLPQVGNRDSFTETVEYRGSDMEMASGALATDMVSASQKRRFELGWVGLTETQVLHATTGVLKAWDAVRAGSATLVTPRGGSYSVTRDVGALEVEVRWYKTASGLRADVRMKLREV